MDSFSQSRAAVDYKSDIILNDTKATRASYLWRTGLKIFSSLPLQMLALFVPVPENYFVVHKIGIEQNLR
ncbi:hypothetical protein HDU67_001816, partial [Dinochytrium kinnereticum]